MIDKKINKKFGGDFELTKNNFNNNNQKTSNLFKKPFVYYLDTGRSAIKISLEKNIKKSSIKKAWIPYFICETVIRPFIELGFDIEYYGMGEKLDNPRGLPNKLNNCVFLFTHYFGKSNVPILKYIEQCADESVVIIEDCVQSCLSKNTGTKGDYLIHSLRKSLPVPDGAILESNTELDLSISKPNEEFISNKLISKLLKGFNIENDEEYLFYYKKGEELLDSKIIPREMSAFSKYIFSNLNLNDIHKKRIKNWLALNEFFNKSSLNTTSLVSVYQNDKNINIPLTYPVKIQNEQRAKILQHLREQKVYCAIHWKLPKTNNKILLEDYKLSKEIFSIPIDQRLSTDDINSLINILISI